MNFIECCELIRDVKENYKIVHPNHLSPSQYSFRFEKEGRQRDAFEVVYFHYRDVMNILPPHDTHSLSSRIQSMNLTLKTALILIQLSNGAWKKVPSFMRDEYETYREVFESITGIEVV